MEKYKCNSCKHTFDEPLEERELLVRDPCDRYETWSYCPRCKSGDYRERVRDVCPSCGDTVYTDELVTVPMTDYYEWDICEECACGYEQFA